MPSAVPRGVETDREELVEEPPLSRGHIHWDMKGISQSKLAGICGNLRSAMVVEIRGSSVAGAAQEWATRESESARVRKATMTSYRIDE